MRYVFGLALVAACGSDRGPGGDGDGAVDAAGGADAVAAVCSGRASQPLDAVWTMTAGGVARSARVHVPASYDPTVPAPVVLDFHGLTMSAQSQETMTRLSAKADVEGFVAVHADGTGSPRGWNAGACCNPAAASGIDDVAFVAALIDELEARLCVDPRRVFATGFSNGGFLSHRLACELSDRIAAIAPVAGVMGLATCTPGRAVPVLQIHGTSDTLVPYAGGGSNGFRSVAATVAEWAARNGCTGEPVETFAQGDARCVSHRGCTDDAEVALCTVTGGGHSWPGGAPFPGGPVSQDLSATDAMWTFFAAHPRPR